jgi:hypothetical protein
MVSLSLLEQVSAFTFHMDGCIAQLPPHRNDNYKSEDNSEDNLPALMDRYVDSSLDDKSEDDYDMVYNVHTAANAPTQVKLDILMLCTTGMGVLPSTSNLKEMAISLSLRMNLRTRLRQPSLTASRMTNQKTKTTLSHHLQEECPSLDPSPPHIFCWTVVQWCM